MSTMAMNTPVSVARASRRPTPAATAAPTRMRLTRRGRVVLVVLAALIGFGIALTAERAVAVAPEVPPVYETVYVAPGQSLWTIATGIAGERDVRDVVAELADLNSLTTSQLQVGQELLVPAAP